MSIPSPSGTFLMDDHSAIEFSGEDWREWLQGQITQDIKLLTPTEPIGFCMCTPTGQLLTFGDLFETEGKGIMIVPSASVDAVLQRVEQMVIMEECEARVVAASIVHSTTHIGSLTNDRVGASGYDHLAFDGDATSSSTFDLLRLLAKRPKFGIDTNPKTLPPELGPEFEARYIHYSKGCYTGQEILQRIHSRGHVNRSWNVYRSQTETVEGFSVTSTVAHPDGGWLLAGFLRHDEPVPAGLTPL